MKKFDFKKEYKNLYLPKDQPALIDVPAIIFIMINGRGDPLRDEFRLAVETIHRLSYAIKMHKMSSKRPKGYFEYVVPPMEGLWWSEEQPFDVQQRDKSCWTLMIRQPSFVTMPIFCGVVDYCWKKRSGIDFTKARLELFTEGKCVQMMHVGRYSEELTTIGMLHKFIDEMGLTDMTGKMHKYHEIYLGNPRKTAPEKLRTVIRLPVA